MKQELDKGLIKVTLDMSCLQGDVQWQKILGSNRGNGNRTRDNSIGFLKRL